MRASSAVHLLHRTGVSFATEEEMKDHYRSEWHRYNLRQGCRVGSSPRGLRGALGARG